MRHHIIHILNILLGCLLVLGIQTSDSQAADAVLLQTEASSSTYTESLAGTLDRINPVFAHLNPVNRDISSLIFEGLTQINEFGEAVPDLAKEWSISSDGLEYVFVLRDDIKWQDGIPFNADDVVYTMSILADDGFPGAQELHKFWKSIEVQKVSDYVVRFRLVQSLGSFLHNLSIGLLPYHALNGTTAAELPHHLFNLSPIGTGPYQLEALHGSDGSASNQVDLRLAPTYRERPEGQSGYQIERIHFRIYPDFTTAIDAYEKNEVDGIASDDRMSRIRLLNQPQTNIHTTIAPSVGILIYNWDEGEKRFFKDLRVREALSIGLNPSSAIQAHLLNLAVPAVSPFLPGSWAYNDALPSPIYDPSRARTLLNGAFIVTGKEPDPEATEDPEQEEAPESSGPIYQFKILVPVESPALVAIAQEIATQWSNLNLDVQVDAVAEAVYRQRIEDGDFDTTILELALSADPDVYRYWHPGQYPDGENYGAVTDDKLASIIERARQDTNGLNRQELYFEFQKIFMSRGIARPLYYPLYTYAQRPYLQNVQLGFISSPADRFRNLQDWTMEKTG
ncbi:peptide ABC transporter substrate-binding protein [Anaerolineales bacterium]